MSIYEAVLKNAEPYFAWDVLSWLFVAMILAIVIVLIDLSFSKSDKKLASDVVEDKSKISKIVYFLIFLKFSKSEKYNHRPKLVQWSIELFPVLLLVLVFRGFIFEPFRVPSNSMMPTLLTGDFILVNKFDYGFRLPITNTKLVEFSKPNRGDVIVFRYPNYEKNPGYSGVDFIKRIVAGPGDVISYKNDQLSINGKSVNIKKIGPYTAVDSGKPMNNYQLVQELLDSMPHEMLLNPNGQSKEIPEITIPDGHYFVMGDNRSHSSDSRFWGFVPEDYIIGRAIGIWMHWDWNYNTMQFSRIGGFN
ncbi:signal peptidase I [Candidatus Thioglobus sp.]|nr:signal peptidase I [Candidatus Thioglobus sp.]|tara:strand:+ start:377 stop:1291 length:915 start_codon:yes stop_codon:yes gene_type:complete